MTHAVVLSTFVLLCTLTRPSSAALNVGVNVPEDLTRQLRHSIFVETAYLAERKVERCSSLDGPMCFAASLGFQAEESGELGRSAVDGPGVVPDQMLHDLGLLGGEVKFVTPEYSVLEAHKRKLEATASMQLLPALADADAAAALRDARVSAEKGILHFAGLMPDSRVPLTFSSGLPSNVVATWDGRWLVRDCSGTSLHKASQLLALPSPTVHQDPLAPALAKHLTASSDAAGLAAPDAASGGGDGGGSFVSTVAEMAGSLGYLRFSRPVLVRSLFARWQPARGTPPGVIGGRRGLNGVWTSHLDPSRLQKGRGWLNVGGDPLQPVDELVFVSTKGLELGAIEVVTHGTAKSGEERSVLLLTPTSGPMEGDSQIGDEESVAAVPQFTLRLERLTPAAAPYVVSLQEAVDRNLRLMTQLQAVALNSEPAGAHIPGLLTPRSPPLLPDTANITWATALTANEQMFEHTILPQAMMRMLSLQPQTLKTNGASSFVKALLAWLDKPPKTFPADLQKLLSEEQRNVAEAVFEWMARGGKWSHRTPSELPVNGTEDAVGRYMSAKRQQTMLDLCTAAFLQMQ